MRAAFSGGRPRRNRALTAVRSAASRHRPGRPLASGNPGPIAGTPLLGRVQMLGTIGTTGTSAAWAAMMAPKSR